MLLEDSDPSNVDALERAGRGRACKKGQRGREVAAVEVNKPSTSKRAMRRTQ